MNPNPENFQNSKLSGLSMIEVLIAISIFTAVSLIALPFGVEQISRQRARSGAQDIVSSLQLAQQRAKTGFEDSGYGIAFQEGEDSYQIYKGDSLASSDWVETNLINGGSQIEQVNLTSGEELSFSQGQLAPNETGDIIITDGQRSYQVSVNSEGLIDYARL